MSICDIPGISTVCTTIGEGPAGLFFGWIASAMGLAVSTLFQGMWEVFSTTTSVDVTSDGYVKVYNILFGIAVFITVLFFCFQLITGLTPDIERMQQHFQNLVEDDQVRPERNQ